VIKRVVIDEGYHFRRCTIVSAEGSSIKLINTAKKIFEVNEQTKLIIEGIVNPKFIDDHGNDQVCK